MSMNKALLDWREAFGRDPHTAFNHLVLGIVPLGVAAPLTLGEILDSLFEPGDISLDIAAAAWLERHMLATIPDDLTLNRWVSVLEEYFRGIALMELPLTGEMLRNQHKRLTLWLHGFYEGPDRDPEGAYLLALTRAQVDRRFSPLWRRLILGQKTAGRSYLSIGILGFRKMPGVNGLPLADVPEGLLQVMVELADQQGTKQAKWKQAMSGIFAAYRRSEKYWVEHLSPLLPAPPQQSNSRDWISALLPTITHTSPTNSVANFSLGRTQPVPRSVCNYWIERVRRHPRECLSSEFSKFLDQHRSYAQTTGEAEYISKTFNNLATSIVRADSKLADVSLSLIEDALNWDPTDSRNWISYAIVLDAARRHDDAIDALWGARHRFAFEPFIRNELSRLLRNSGDLETAAQVCREAISHFPTDVVCRTSLAETLRAMGKLDDARAVYEQACHDFPGSNFCRNGLAETLRAMGKIDDALSVYERACLETTDLACRSGLADLLIDLDRLDEAERVCRSGLEIDTRNYFLKSGLARVLSIRSARDHDVKLRDEAKNILQELADNGVRSAISGLRFFDKQWERATTDSTVKFRNERKQAVATERPVKSIVNMSAAERLGRAMICLWKAEHADNESLKRALSAEAHLYLEIPEKQVEDTLLSAFVETRGLIYLASGDAQKSLEYFEDQINLYGRGGWISVRLGVMRAQTLLGKPDSSGEASEYFRSQTSRFALHVATVIQALSSAPHEQSIKTLLKSLYPSAEKFSNRARLDVRGGLTVKNGAEMLGAFLRSRWFRPAGIESLEDIDRPDTLGAVVDKIKNSQAETFDVIYNSTLTLAA